MPETSATFNSTSMPRPRHYSPIIPLPLVRVLYHEARHRGIPMTRLVNTLLAEQLHGTHGWNQVHPLPEVLHDAPVDPPQS